MTSLTSPEFGAALKQISHQRIGLHVAFFEHKAYSVFPDNQGWIMVDEETRFEVAAKLKAVKYPAPGYTRTDIATEYALEKLQDCKTDDIDGVNVIDIMTDGKLNFPGCLPGSYSCHQGIPFAIAARDEATRRGVSINVLAMVIDTERDLPEWAKRFMVTPSGEEQQNTSIMGPKGPIKPGMLFILPDAEKQDAAEWEAAFSALKKQKLIVEMGMIKEDRWNDFASRFGLPHWSDGALATRVSYATIPTLAALVARPN
jgi:hypothetical protein